MSRLLHIDAEYKQWIQDLSLRYRPSRIKASIRVNSEMLSFYWSVGKNIAERQFENKYGSHFYENLSRDLVAALNIKKVLAPTSLRYTKYFYQLYSRCLRIVGNLPKNWICCSVFLGLTIKRLLTKYKATAK